MKHIVFSIIIFTIYAFQLHAQQNKIVGEYELSGVRETASAIQLNQDSTFRFYFSYGALDRYGSGKWSLRKGSVILDSKPYPGKDFKMVSSALIKNNFTTIKIEDKNINLYRLVYCRVATPAGDSIINATVKGIIVIPNNVDSIHLLCELCYERKSSFAINPQKYNYYTLNFEPWITEVFFKSFVLRYTQDGLQGKHPLLDEKEYTFIRVK